MSQELYAMQLMRTIAEPSTKFCVPTCLMPQMSITGVFTNALNLNPPFQKVQTSDPLMHTSVPITLAFPLQLFIFTLSILHVNQHSQLMNYGLINVAYKAVFGTLDIQKYSINYTVIQCLFGARLLARFGVPPRGTLGICPIFLLHKPIGVAYSALFALPINKDDLARFHSSWMRCCSGDSLKDLYILRERE